MQNTDRSDVPVKTQDDKLASIDSSIESCISILLQEIRKRQVIALSKNDEKGYDAANEMTGKVFELKYLHEQNKV